MGKISIFCLIVFIGCEQSIVEPEGNEVLPENNVSVVYNNLFAPQNVNRIKIDFTSNIHDNAQVNINDLSNSITTVAGLQTGNWSSIIEMFDSEGNIINSEEIDIEINEESEIIIGIQYQQLSSEVGIVSIENESQNCVLSSDFIVNPYDLNPVIQKDSNWNYNLVVGPNVLFHEEKYLMWYTGNGSTPFQVGLAYSTDGYTWENEQSNPVLQIGNDNEFDSHSIRWPYVIYDEGILKMWYAGSKNSLDWQIGYAESSDGIVWQKYINNPVFTSGGNTWESYSVRLGAVVKENGNYHLWYDGSSDGFQTTSSIGYATSTDGINWTRVGEGPILRAGSEFFATYKVSVGDVHWIEDKYFEMFYTGVNENIERSVGRAVSHDGVSWLHDPNNPIIPHSVDNTWNEYSSSSSVFERVGNNYRFWFSGQDGTGDWNIGVADGTLICE